MNCVSQKLSTSRRPKNLRNRERKECVLHLEEEKLHPKPDIRASKHFDEVQDAEEYHEAANDEVDDFEEQVSVTAGFLRDDFVFLVGHFN